MTTKSLLLGATASLLLFAPAQAAKNDGWYGGLEGGASWVQGVDVFETRNAGATSFFDHVSYNTGWAVLATVGYEWQGWRFEGEAGYRHDDMKRIQFSNGFASSDIDNFGQLTLMANMLYDIPLSNRFGLSLGAGVGADRSSFNWPGFGGGFKDEDWQFAWQLIAGLNYDVGNGCEVFVDYRFLDANGPTFEEGVYRLYFDDVTTHTATAGLRYHFGS